MGRKAALTIAQHSLSLSGEHWVTWESNQGLKPVTQTVWSPSDRPVFRYLALSTDRWCSNCCCCRVPWSSERSGDTGANNADVLHILIIGTCPVKVVKYLSVMEEKSINHHTPRRVQNLQLDRRKHCSRVMIEGYHISLKIVRCWSGKIKKRTKML